MSGGGNANSSWTILTSEETVAETLKPLTGGADHNEESQTSATGPGENHPPVNGAEAADAPHAEDHPVSEEQTAVLNGDPSTDQHTSEPTAVTDDPITSSPEVTAGAVQSADEAGQTQVLPEEPAQFSADPDSFSDSYTHVTPSPDEPPLAALSPETLGGAESSLEEEKLSQEGTQPPLNGEKLQQEEEESDYYLRTTEEGKQAEPTAESEVGDEGSGKTPEEEDPDARRRRSLLAALEQIGRRDEEEVEEEFQLPERDDSGFSVNKCILGALILLGLGTIFFSGVFMDLDEESDYSPRELKDAAAPGKQEWLNPEVPPPSVAADNSELLNKLAEGNEQISVLQAQLQAQKEELKVAMGHAAEGAAERLRWEEVEKENSRLKTDMASLAVLQKENERMKKELEAVPALLKEVETLRSTVTELSLCSAVGQSDQEPVKTTTPPSGQPEDSRPDTAGSDETPDRHTWTEQKEKKRDKYDVGEKKNWKEKEKYAPNVEKSEHRDGGKTERKREKHEFDKHKEREGKEKRHSEETKPWKDKEWKKEKDRRGDEGKPWKNRDGKKEWKEKSDKRELKEAKDKKKGKFEKVNEGKQWRGKEENKDWKKGKDHGEKHKSKEEWKGEKEWKKSKDGYRESGREKKEWKEKGEKKEWRNGNGKDRGREGRGERKQWEGGKHKERPDEWKSKNGKHDKEWKRKDEKRQQWKDAEDGWKRGNGKKDKPKKKPPAGHHGHKEEHVYGDPKPAHSHSKPSVGQPEYWLHQRDRLQHNPKPPQLCESVESCAEAERLTPVPLAEFEAVLHAYLTKAEEAGVDKAKIEQLQRLTPDFFKDGLFVHDQMSFQDFVEDLGDILEDMVEGDEAEEEPDSAIEDEMEGFELEVLRKFALAGAGGKEKRAKGEWRKESRQGRG